jgi:AcrR family transcriptional regulator
MTVREHGLPQYSSRSGFPKLLIEVAKLTRPILRANRRVCCATVVQTACVVFTMKTQIMPRRPDPETKSRILDAACRLYHRHGEESLTLRAVAKAAGTTTPSVYKRFKSRNNLLKAIGARTREKFFSELTPTLTLEAACRLYLDFAVAHKNEYRLVFGLFRGEMFSHLPKQPAVEWAKQQLAKRFGGDPAEHAATSYTLRFLLHGAASLLVNVPKDGKISRTIRQQCIEACDAVIASARRQ